MAAPVDRRLLRESGAARRHLALIAGLGVVQCGLILAQAGLLGEIVGRSATYGVAVTTLRTPLIALALVLGGRALVSAGFEMTGRLGAARVMSELRGRLVDHLLVIAPGRRARQLRTGELAASAVQGVDALEAYFAGYLPQLILASVVPLAVLVYAAILDPVTALIFAITIPILIMFMVLIGKGTQAKTRRRLGALALLSAHFLDVVRGLETLRAYRRERVQEAVLSDVGEQYRRETMATLRIAFMSALVLELCAMLGIALVAATIGVQLAGGHLTLQAGLTVLLLGPELYAPLREVGQQFHASADGVAAYERIFETMAAESGVPRAAAPRQTPAAARATIRFEAVTFAYPERPDAVLDDVSLEFEPGTITALVGPSGSGKSTLARLLMRFDDPSTGRVSWGDVDLRELDVDDWRSQVGWVPQQPTLFTGTVAENIRLGAPDADAQQLADALSAAGAEELVAGLPDGLATVVGEGGRRLSAGQRQRLALARAFLRDAPILVLDEPTAHLDAATAAEVGEGIARVARGRTTLLIVHHAALAAHASKVVTLEAGRVQAPTTPPRVAA